uniref:Uncharacterized protein n=1 Tax=Candidatus Caldatribacterium saccharofermentans TaxID=1454753 RepID=A0A7V4THW2_9BACT
MEKASKRKITVRIQEGGRDWKGGKEVRTLLSQFPLPPFVTQEVPLLPIQRFFRATLGVFRYIVLVTQGELLAFFQAFLKNSLLREKALFLCSSQDGDLLGELCEVLPPSETAFLFLARRPEEFWGLFALFALPERKKVLVGEPHGAFAECARECFFPFLPVDVPSFSFWQRSAFLYLPLSVWGMPPEEVERGFQEGYTALREEAFRLALFLWEKEQEGKGRVHIVAEPPLLGEVLSSFFPLLERSCEGGLVFRAGSPQTLWNEGERVWERGITILVLRALSGEGFRVRIPRELVSSEIFAGWGFLRECSFEALEKAAIDALRGMLRQRGEAFAELCLPLYSPFFLGQCIAFMQYLACYSAWLREVDIFSEPPLVRFERHVVSCLKKRCQEA